MNKIYKPQPDNKGQANADSTNDWWLIVSWIWWEYSHIVADVSKKTEKLDLVFVCFCCTQRSIELAFFIGSLAHVSLNPNTHMVPLTPEGPIFDITTNYTTTNM